MTAKLFRWRTAKDPSSEETAKKVQVLPPPTKTSQVRFQDAPATKSGEEDGAQEINIGGTTTTTTTRSKPDAYDPNGFKHIYYEALDTAKERRRQEALDDANPAADGAGCGCFGPSSARQEHALHRKEKHAYKHHLGFRGWQKGRHSHVEDSFHTVSL